MFRTYLWPVVRFVCSCIILPRAFHNQLFLVYTNYVRACVCLLVFLRVGFFGWCVCINRRARQTTTHTIIIRPLMHYCRRCGTHGDDTFCLIWNMCNAHTHWAITVVIYGSWWCLSGGAVFVFVKQICKNLLCCFLECAFVVVCAMRMWKMFYLCGPE